MLAKRCEKKQTVVGLFSGKPPKVAARPSLSTCNNNIILLRVLRRHRHTVRRMTKNIILKIRTVKVFRIVHIGTPKRKLREGGVPSSVQPLVSFSGSFVLRHYIIYSAYLGTIRVLNNKMFSYT